MGSILKTQESKCVFQCEFPYEEVEPGKCGIACADGFYFSGALKANDTDELECSPCLVEGCKHCTEVHKCTYCHPFGHKDYSSSCHLTCPPEIPLFDEVPNKGGKKCVSECESERSVPALNDDRCLYCGVGCIECENVFITSPNDVQCNQCEEGLYILGKDCVKTCPKGCWTVSEDTCVKIPNCVQNAS